eukprot:1340189-Amorphochlora_amoeboformis.AAC.1
MEQALTRASDIFKPEVSCVFAFLHLRIPLDLIHIVTRVRGAEYNPKSCEPSLQKVCQDPAEGGPKKSREDTMGQVIRVFGTPLE